MPKPETLRRKPEGQNPKAETLRPKPGSLKPKHQGLNLKAATRRPKPESRNPKAEILRPKPQSRNRFGNRETGHWQAGNSGAQFQNQELTFQGLYLSAFGFEPWGVGFMASASGFSALWFRP